MFQLEPEVQRWCKKAIPFYWLRPSCFAELQDHLLCSVEQQTIKGASEEQAFSIATQQLSEAKLLRDEFRKNAKYSRSRSVKIGFKLAAISCVVLIVAATLRSVYVTAVTHQFLVAIYSLPAKFFHYFS